MKIYSLATGGKKEDEAPILPRFVSDSIIDLQDEKKGVEAEIEAVDQAKLVSGKRKAIPQPAKIVMKKKAKKTSTSPAVCDLFIGSVLIMIGITIIGLSLGKMLVYYRNGQMEYQNNLVRVVLDNQNILQKNQNKMYKGINDMVAKVSKMSKSHIDTKDELYVVEYDLNDLHNDLETLKDSVKHIEEERLHSDDDIELDADDDSPAVAVVLDSGYREDSENKKLPKILENYYSWGTSTTTETTTQAPQRDEYPVDYSEYDSKGSSMEGVLDLIDYSEYNSEGKIYYIH